MKKFIAIILTVIFVLSLASCADPYGDVISQLEEMDMRGYFYTASQIESFTEENKIEESIVAFANFSQIDEEENEVYLYVVELETEAMAKSYLNTHTLDFKYAFAKGTVVIYGSNSVINDLDL